MISVETNISQRYAKTRAGDRTGIFVVKDTAVLGKRKKRRNFGRGQSARRPAGACKRALMSGWKKGDVVIARWGPPNSFVEFPVFSLFGSVIFG
jgi:hypothetical protein